MDADKRRLEINRITRQVIGCCFKIANALGPGFLEKVYENSLAHELRKQGLHADQQFPVPVAYDGAIVGEYVADLLVERSVLVELKAARELEDAHMAQCMNYLKATGLRICLLVNFGRPRVQIKRIVNNF